MFANFSITAKDFYEIVDALEINYHGLYPVLVAQGNIDLHCKAYGIQKRHMLSRIEKVRNYLENNN